VADEQEFEAFYEAAFPRLVGQIGLVTGDLAEAEDLVQEALARASARWSRLRAYEVPEAWVRRVAHNLAASHAKKSAARSPPWPGSVRHRSCRPSPRTRWRSRRRCGPSRRRTAKSSSCTTWPTCRSTRSHESSASRVPPSADGWPGRAGRWRPNSMNPPRRYEPPMAEQLQERLEALAAAYQDAARPPGPSPARRRGRRRRRYQASGAGLLALALVAVGVTLGSQLLKELRSAPVAPATSPRVGSDPALEAIPPAKDVSDGFNQRTGPIVLVTQGVANRSTWKLATYPSGERTCSVVIRDGSPVEYGCGFDVPGRRPVMSAWTTAAAASASSVFVHGQVVQQAARVRIEFADHGPIDLPVLQAPTDVGVRFFAASIRLPGALPTAVVAVDEHGTELGRQKLRFATKGGGNAASG
jgi:hypothetical protein